MSSLTNWRAVSATGASEVLVRSPSFCSFRAQVCWNLFTQGAALGCILIGLSARLCTQHQLLYGAMGYTPVDLSARLCSQHQLMYDAMVIRLIGLSARLCSQHQLVYSILGYTLLPFRGRKKKCLAKFVSFVERRRSLNFQERKIRFFRFIRCEKIISL